jgi:hypothetical protein
MRTGKEVNPVLVWYSEPSGRQAKCVGNLTLAEMFGMIAWSAGTSRKLDPTPEQLMRRLWPDPTDCLKDYAQAHNNQLPSGGVDEDGNVSYAAQKVDWCLKYNSSLWVAELAAYANFSEWLTNTLAAKMPKPIKPA